MKGWHEIDLKASEPPASLGRGDFGMYAAAVAAFKRVLKAAQGLPVDLPHRATSAKNELRVHLGRGPSLHIRFSGKDGFLNAFAINGPDGEIQETLRRRLHRVGRSFPPADLLYWPATASWEIKKALEREGISGCHVRHKPHVTMIRARPSRYIGRQSSSTHTVSSDEVFVVIDHRGPLGAEIKTRHPADGSNPLVERLITLSLRWSKTYRVPCFTPGPGKERSE